MQQDKLFFDDENDALVTAILSAGGYKQVAGKLWPHRKADSAYARLKACLDPQKHEKLEFGEMLAIARMARENGCHAFMQYLGQELLYECKAIGPKDELANALEVFDSKADEILRAIQAVQRAKVRAAS